MGAAGGEKAMLAIGATEGAAADEREQDALNEAAAVGAVNAAAAALGADFLAGQGWRLVGHRVESLRIVGRVEAPVKPGSSSARRAGLPSTSLRASRTRGSIVLLL